MSDEDWLTLSILEHHVYCRWQARLLQDGVWEDNHLTVQGSAAHERVDTPGVDRRRGARLHRRVHLASSRWRIYGVADVIEEQPDGSFMPVEHKWGRGAGDLRPSAIQVAAQALCIEEMLTVTVESIGVFVVSERRRHIFALDEWRQPTIEAIESARHDLLMETFPEPVFAARRCRRCSVRESCQPHGGNRAE